MQCTVSSVKFAVCILQCSVCSMQCAVYVVQCGVQYEIVLFSHNCIATADRAVVVLVKEFQWDQRPQPLQNGLALS